MTENVVQKNMEPFENFDLVPLENLKLKDKTSGVVKYIDALSESWVIERYYLHYEAPHIYDENGCEIPGAKARWIEIVNYMMDDLKWLLSLPFYRFWSNIVYNTSILDTLVSFLQEAPPYYALQSFPNCPEMLALLEKLSHFVLLIFTRLITNKESAKEYMSYAYFGNLLYENYIFTIPIILDLCQHYGRENEKIVEKILNCIFALEPRYTNDLQKTVPSIVEALGNVEKLFEIDSTDSLSCIENNSLSTLTLLNLEDMIFYVLDITSTLNVFLKNYHAAVSIFHKECFITKIIAIYAGTISAMYKTLNKLAYNDENMPKYVHLKHCLDVIRIEVLNLCRVIIYEPVQHIQEYVNTMEGAEIKEQVDKYFNTLNSAISEERFITVYNELYPVETDLKLLRNIYPEIDEIKCDYVLQSITAIVGHTSDSCNTANEAVAGPSGISHHTITSIDANTYNVKETSIRKNSVELASLISEVKDILYDLDERFIEISLEYYAYDSEAVINAVLEDALPPKLKELKDLGPSHVPSPPPTYQEAVEHEELIYDADTLDVINNFNDCHVKTREVVQVPKEYIINNYSLIPDEYDDEYDDTYDKHNIRGIIHDDVTELDSGPFTTPRVLSDTRKVEITDELESEDEDEDSDQNGVDHFIPNPAELRARAEQRREAKRGRNIASNAHGKVNKKGQDGTGAESNKFDKSSAKKRNTNFTKRRAWIKKNQGMLPF